MYHTQTCNQLIYYVSSVAGNAELTVEYDSSVAEALSLFHHTTGEGAFNN